MPADDEKVFKTIFTVTVLSKGKVRSNIDLTDLDYAITHGDCIGDVEMTSQREVNPSRIKRELEDIGNDGSFFGETDD